MAQNSIKVSYIITTRNRSRYLDRALENVREFITSDDELIVMDGGSTDETPEIVKKHLDIISLFRSEPDYGEAHGYNKGILESKGRYIKVLTDDDYFFPDAMQKAISIMEDNPELDAVICGGEVLDFNPVTKKQVLRKFQQLPSNRTLTDDVENVSIYITCGIGLIFTRRAVSRVGIFDTSFHAVDLDYLARLMTLTTEFKYLNLKLWRHVTYPHSGENNKEKCRWDYLRVSIRYGRWNRIILDSEDNLKKALGLNSVDHGSLIITILKEANWMREKMPVVLFILAWILRMFHRCCYLAGAVFRLSYKLRKKGQITKEEGLSLEPEWDGNLR